MKKLRYFILLLFCYVLPVPAEEGYRLSPRYHKINHPSVLAASDLRVRPLILWAIARC